MTNEPERTVLYEEHKRLGAMLIDFHGWEMPVRYTSIPQEHQQVRESAGLFDLCHMGRLAISGPQAEEWLQALITNDTAAIETGNARYTLFCQEDGTILDDAIVYRLEESFLLVVNASNTTKIIDWMTSHRDGREAELEDLTRSEAMISIQGPDALACTIPLLEAPENAWDSLGYYQIISAQYESEPVLAARTGYTGEDGLELYLAGDPGVRLWRQLLETGGNRTAPIGLGARDTLRLEAGMPLYGNDIDETTNPYCAGLGFAVKLDKETPFPGQQKLREIEETGPSEKLCGFIVESRRIARTGMEIYAGDEKVGRITSGAPSPTIQEPIAMGYLDCDYLDRLAGGQAPEPEVDLRGKREKLRLEHLPFFSRKRKKTV
ncbi:MAG: glycine cleavage system aminomethyltransferase GcvT [Planctomycetota bacterium]|nr:glycine cleavage system protein T [Planctomycetota bacterium]MEE3053261.1 glycine cleavage system aminomethyltransferase GcvT [Planctomycetota bacterium]